MSIPSLSLCLAVVEKQTLNLSLIHKEMIATLNLKGRDVLSSMNDLFNERTLQEFVRHSPFIDHAREKYFCQNAFELSWLLAKAQHLYKVIK